MKNIDADKQAVKEITKTVRKEITSQVKEAMDSLNEKIAKATKSWKGVDVDKFMDEMRGREPEVDLEEQAEEYIKKGKYFPEAFIVRPVFIAGAQWQKAKDEEAIKTAEDHAFLAGADWQKEQFEKNRLANCDKLTKEEYDRETDFATEIIEKEHRQPTFTDAINYGMRVMKDQIMKEAVEAHVVQSFNPCTEEGEPTLHAVLLLYKDDGKPYLVAGEDARIIILPKED